MDKEITNKKFWEKVAKLYTPMQERKNRKLYQELGFNMIDSSVIVGEILPECILICKT